MSQMIDDIITDVLRAEGWDKFTNRPNDKGGPTKWGITLSTFSEHVQRYVSISDLRQLTEAEARAFYRQRYFEQTAFEKLPPLIIPLVVDCAVNHGRKRASKWVQKAVGAAQDGVIGPKTLAAAAQFPAMTVYLNICAYRVRFYGALVGRDHTQAEFISGWNNRAAKFIVALADLLKDS